LRTITELHPTSRRCGRPYRIRAGWSSITMCGSCHMVRAHLRRTRGAHSWLSWMRRPVGGLTSFRSDLAVQPLSVPASLLTDYAG
jgi:hypothetical protein